MMTGAPSARQSTARASRADAPRSERGEANGGANKGIRGGKARRLAPLLVIALAALAALLGAGVKPGGGSGAADGAKPVASLADGRLSLSNSRSGSAIFTASGIGPGDSQTGTVTITNAGTLQGFLALSNSNLIDAIGPSGGQLSTWLHLLVQDVTQAGAPVTIYTGKVGAMTAQALGRLAPGEGRSYRFTVSFPDGGVPASATTGDNAYMGSSMKVQYDWRAVAPGPAPDRAPPRLRLFVPRVQRVTTRRYLAVYVSCSEACALGIRGSLPAGARRKRLAFGAQTRVLAARSPARLRLRLFGKALDIVRRSLARRGRITAGLRMSATDGAGNRASVKRRIHLKRR